MASTGAPTPNIGLNQWLSSDKPERMDFNSDNQKIDDALGDSVEHIDEVKSLIGTLTELETEEKSNIVGAINELKTSLSVTPVAFEIPQSAWLVSGTHPELVFEAVLSVPNLTPGDLIRADFDLSSLGEATKSGIATAGDTIHGAAIFYSQVQPESALSGMYTVYKV